MPRDSNLSAVDQKIDVIKHQIINTAQDSPAARNELFYVFVNSLHSIRTLPNHIVTQHLREALLTFKQNDADYSLNSLILFLHSLTAQIRDVIDSSKNSTDIVSRVRAFVLQHITDNVSIASLATALNYNQSYLSTIYKLRANENLKDMILHEKINYATNALLSSNIKVTDLSHQLGFQSPSYFGTIFKNHTGETPSDYRIHHYYND